MSCHANKVPSPHGFNSTSTAAEVKSINCWILSSNTHQTSVHIQHTIELSLSVQCLPEEKWCPLFLPVQQAMSETKNALGKKGPLPETQVKFFIVIQLKEISVSVKSTSLISSYVLVDWTARQKKWTSFSVTPSSHNKHRPSSGAALGLMVMFLNLTEHLGIFVFCLDYTLHKVLPCCGG